MPSPSYPTSQSYDMTYVVAFEPTQIEGFFNDNLATDLQLVVFEPGKFKYDTFANLIKSNTDAAALMTNIGKFAKGSGIALDVANRLRHIANAGLGGR